MALSSVAAPAWLLAAIVVIAVWGLLLLIRSRCSISASSRPTTLPIITDARALFQRFREDAFLIYMQHAAAAAAASAAATAAAAAAPSAPSRGAAGAATVVAEGGLVATADPGLVRRLLLSRAHSVGRSVVYRLVAWVMPAADGMLFAADAEWRRRHSLLTPLFGGAHVARFAADVFAAGARAAEGALRPEGGEEGGEGEGEGEGEGAPPAHRPLSGSALLADALADAQPPLGAGRGAGAEAARTRRDLLSLVRWAGARVLLAWGLGAAEDEAGGGAEAATASVAGASEFSVGASAAASPAAAAAAAEPALGASRRARARRLARLLDAYSRTCFELMPEAERGARGAWPSALLNWLAGYAALHRAARALRLALRPYIAEARAEAAAAVAANKAPAAAAGTAEEAAPAKQTFAAAPAPQSALARMVAAGWSEREVASELNHLHGAHKAAAFLAACALFELSAHGAARAALAAELEAVCGRPPKGLSAAQMAAHARAALAAGAGDAPAGAGAAWAWRPPSRADLERGRLPVLARTMKETLRRHVVSMGALRRVGEGGVELPAASGGAGAGAGAGAGGAPSLPEGAEVMILLHALHHDARSWGADAHVWEPARWDARSEYWARRRRAEGGGGGGEGAASASAAAEESGTLPPPQQQQQHQQPSGEGAAAPPGLDPSTGFPALAPDAFFPFLDGTRRCAGMLLAQLEFAGLLYAFLVPFDVRARLEDVEVADGDEEAGKGEGKRRGGAEEGGAPAEGIGGGVAVGAARLLRRPPPGGAVAVLADPLSVSGARRGVRHHLVRRADFFSAIDGDIPYDVTRR